MKHRDFDPEELLSLQRFSEAVFGCKTREKTAEF